MKQVLKNKYGIFSIVISIISLLLIIRDNCNLASMYINGDENIKALMPMMEKMMMITNKYFIGIIILIPTAFLGVSIRKKESLIIKLIAATFILITLFVLIFPHGWKILV